MKPLVLAILSALLSVLVFPRFDLRWLAPLCLAPLLVAVAWEPSPRRRALIGWVAGFIYWFGVCYWIRDVLELYGGMNLPLVWLSFLLFCLLKAMTWALFAWLAGMVIHRAWAIPAIAALWTGIERIYGPFGFAWFALGNAGIDMGIPMRLAPITGVYGLSFVFAMMNAAVALLVLRRPRIHLAPLLALGGLYLLPLMPDIEKGTETAVVVQPNIEERQDWTTEQVQDTLRRMALQSLDLGAGVSGSRLILWPEVPAPFYFETDAYFRDQVQQLTRLTRSDMLFSAVGRTPSGAPQNSAFQVGPDGATVARYDKINLVPFGEYTPPLLNWIDKISSEAGSFIPGSRQLVFPLMGGKAGTFICYESVFPHFVREFVAQGAGLLVNLSNDGYFGRTSAREQHLLLVRMRAAENRRWLIRATNDGITATIDPAGRIDHRLNPFRQASARMRFSWGSDLTFYSRYGDVFVWLCLAVGVGLAGWEWNRNRGTV